MLRDKVSHFKHELLFAKTLDGTSKEEPANGVDLKGYSAATVVCSVGSMTNTGNSPDVEKWELSLEESDSESSGFSAVDEDDMLLDYGTNDGSVTSGVFATIDDEEDGGLADNQNFVVGYIGTKRYIRVVADPSSDSPGDTPIAVTVIKEALQKPASE